MLTGDHPPSRACTQHGRLRPALGGPERQPIHAILPLWMSSTCATSTPSALAPWPGASSAAASARAGKIPGSARARDRLRHALSGPVPRRSRTLPRSDAGAAGRGALAFVAAGACRAGRGGRSAADRFSGRSRPPGACAGNVDRSGRAAARSVARPRRRRAAACGGPEPARAVGAHGHDAVRPWPPLFALADHASAARDLVHADRMGRSALRAADRARLVPALGGGLGTRRRDPVGPVRRRAYRRGDEASLSRHPGAAREFGAGCQPVLAPSPGAAALSPFDTAER